MPPIVLVWTGSACVERALPARRSFICARAAATSIVSTGVPGVAASKILIVPERPMETGWLKLSVRRVSGAEVADEVIGVVAAGTRAGEITATAAPELVAESPAVLLATTV